MVPVFKLVLLTTDGALATTSGTCAFNGPCKKEPPFSRHFSYHCVFHQQPLFAEVIDFQHMMSFALRRYKFVTCYVPSKWVTETLNDKK
jgi:hypothetical protein